MKILKIRDQDDGSCIMDCEFTEGEVDFFLNYAVNDILRKQIERMSDEHRSDGNNREVQSDEALESKDN